MTHLTSLTLTAVLAATLAAPHAGAAKPKPVSRTYTATAPTPDPTNYASPVLPAGTAVSNDYETCAQRVPGSFHAERVRIPAAGRLVVELTGYTGDWDALLLDSNKRKVTFSGSTELNVRETMTATFRRATTVTIVVCNWAGGPEGTVRYTFTFR